MRSKNMQVSFCTSIQNKPILNFRNETFFCHRIGIRLPIVTTWRCTKYNKKCRARLQTINNRIIGNASVIHSHRKKFARKKYISKTNKAKYSSKSEETEDETGDETEEETEHETGDETEEETEHETGDETEDQPESNPSSENEMESNSSKSNKSESDSTARKRKPTHQKRTISRKKRRN